MNDSQYATYIIPRQPNPAFAKKFASINRNASRSIPGLVLYRSHELLWNEDQWSKQLNDPRKFHFITVSKRSTTKNEKPPTLENGEWVGMCALTGPISKGKYGGFDAPGDSDPESDLSDNESETFQETLWHAARVYLRPAHKNATAFFSMVQAYTQFICDFTPNHLGLPPSHCRARVQTTLSSTSTLMPLYEATGARCIDVITLHDSLRASNSLKDVPSDALCSSDFTKRNRPLLEWLVEC